MKKRNKILFIIPLFLLLVFGTITTAQTSEDFQNSSFYKKILQLDIPVGNILLGNTLTRYDFTRLLNAIECQDCIIPDSTMVAKYNEEKWQLFQQLPGKYFEDVEYLSGTYNGTNYYYCVANIGSDDIMNGYPRGSGKCGGKFCGQWNVTKAEFYQTLSNFLMDRNMFNYAAPWGEIKKWYNKLKTNEPGYKYLNTAQIALIKTKGQETEQITTRLEYTTYLAFCTFNPGVCGFQTFPELSAGSWPIAETNVLIRAGIITTNDVYSLNSAITPADALEKMWITYDRHIKCEFDSDYDCDSIPNHDDNCPYDYNPTQNDFDGDGMGDVCDDDIDGDGVLNPVGFVDDNGTINYGLLKTYPSTDKTPFGEQMEDTAYFIQVNSIGQGSPVNVQFGIAGPEEPKSVEWDFGDLGKSNGKQVSHNFNGQGVYTITAKLTTKGNRKHILTTQIFLGQTSDISYNLNIAKATIDKDTATFEAESQGKFDYFERENKATGERKQLRGATKFTTTLKAGVRNNITLKGYANDMIVATASADVYDNNGKFYTFTPVFAPLLKSINTNITASIRLVNIPLKTIDNIAWDFGDGTSFMDTKISNKHIYQSEGKKIIVQRLDLDNGAHLYATSTLNIQDPSIIGNQTYNVIPSFSKKSVKLIFNNKGITIKDGDSLSAIINSQQQITLDKPKENASFLELADKQGVVRVNVKLRHGGLTLENNGVITFGLKDQTAINIGNIDALFSGLKCDLDKDGVPDIYDGDIDGDGIPNLLGLVTKEREDCKLVVGENIDQKLYDKHFGICSLDNCPFRSNSDQADLNVNGIGDICEGNGECGNNIIDLGENCKTCKEDVGVCSAYCGNGKQEAAENCKNCPQDMKVCPSLCGNGIIDSGEQCDHGSDNNGKDGECTIACKVFDYLNPNCGNGIYDEGEDCISCPVDLGDICIDDGITTCGDDKIDPGETCINCSKDVGDCTAYCGNGIVEEAENCSNCSEDIGICTSSCGNGTLEVGEQCDNGRYNGYDGKCSKYCRIVDINHECGDGIKDEYEQCDQGKNNGKISSRCTKMCTTYNPLKPLCGNGVIDPGENCLTCPVDLGEKCSATCGNGTIEIGEECDNGTNNGYDGKCSFECKDSTKNCGNKKVDAGEDCSNCSTDIGSCTSSCGNGTVEPGEQCDNGKYNGYDGKCSKYCKIVDTNHKCGDNHKDEYEECDKGTNNGKPSSLCTLMCTKYDSSKPNCGNGKIDSGETCTTCPVDLGERCSATCGNGKKEVGEQCDNGTNNGYDGKCSFDCKTTTSKCGNSIKETGEDCDDGAANGTKNSKNNCSKRCTTNISTKSTCGNSVVEGDEECDLGKNKNGKKNYNCTSDCKEKNSCPNNELNEKEKCNNCSADLKDICINDGQQPGECGNKILEPGENCSNCPNDVGKCTGFCGNGIIEAAEDCSNCPKDVGSCTSSHGNGIVEPGEECDNGAGNGNDGKCSEDCKIVDPNHECGDNHQDEYEECDLGKSNGMKGSTCTKMCTTYNPLLPNCGNGEIDIGETCLNCPVDLGTKCSAKCGNGKTEVGEECDNGIYNGYNGKCSFECTRTTAVCGNGKREGNEKCDDGPNNGSIDSPNKCSEKCTKLISTTPVCGNGVKEGDEGCDLGKNKNGKKNYNCTTDCKEKNSCPNNKKDKNETCETCPEDLGDICITEGKEPGECGNGIVEDGEDCKNCEKDVKSCTAFCGNGIVEEAENCSNCSKDAKNCGGSCGNGTKEAGEECDHGRRNGLDGKCSEDCKVVDSNHECGDNHQDEYEECDKGSENGKPSSLCTLMCTKYNSSKPDCGNGVIDYGENCTTCPVDLGDKCSIVCGNGKKEIGEQCDNGVNNGYDGKCSFECKTTKTKCGNEVVETGEDCDDGGANGTANSKNNCSIKCTTNISPKPVCGNGVKEGDEECDLGKKKNGNKRYNCTAECKEVKSCPNNKIDKEEDCETCAADLKDKCIDDGENTGCGNQTADTDENCKTCKKDVGTCNAYCGNKTIEAAEDCSNCSKDVGKCTGSCGNGIVEPGEQCDNGSNNNGTDGLCGPDCKSVNPNQKCGNGGKPEGTEECDDGDNNGTLASNCTIMCTKKDPVKPLCGNGIVDVGETCLTCPIDLGTKCLHICGDGKVNKPYEECDNGDKNGIDGKCGFDCKKTTAVCGNKIKEKGEQCDEGENNGGDTCTEKCRTVTKPVCGNGKKETGEECDYGSRNGTTNSICGNDCKKVKTCGDGIIQKKETCQNCPEDLKDKCIDDGENPGCGNEIADGNENCTTCDKDVGKCNAYCGNTKIEAAEDCVYCQRDVGKCTGSCGNGIVEPGEQCDNGSNNNDTDGLCGPDCKSVNPNQKCGNGGDPEGTEQCDDGDKNGTIESNCTVMCVKKDPLKPLCGNGVIDLGETCTSCPVDLGTKCLHICGDGKVNKPYEECDSGEENGKDGICGFDCKKSKSICGNGIKEKGEQCDEGTGNLIGDICTEKCKTVTKPVCGNGKKEFGEECDYGSRNGLKTSICGTDCKKVKTCGDGEIQKNETCQNCPEDLKERCITDNVCGNGVKEENEECDDGRQNGKNKNCDKDCKKIDKCGNKRKDEGETCKTCPQDLGPCTAKCGNGIVESAENCLNCPEDVGECTSSCGNGIIEEGEQCDNGYQNGKDRLCSKTCEIIIDKTKPYCGDGKVNTQREKCDAGDDNGKSTCSYICTEVFWPATCGNGIIDPTETCMNCALDLGKKCQTKCGNGKIDTPREECDNGGRNGRDGKCTTQCKIQKVTICGNGTPEEGEECDHGTENGKDKECTKKCTKYNSEHPNCGNGIVDDDENCINCSVDVGLCIGSCGNGKLEEAEECDHGTENGKDNLCDKDCRNIDPNKLCGNGYTNEDEGEQCDDGEQNGINGQCSLNCKKVTRPNCGNGKIESDENCNNCPEDLGVKCLSYCGDKNVSEGEQCDNGTEKNGKDGICTARCMDVEPCGNGEEDEEEDCISCSEDLGDKCIDHGDECPNGQIENNENCMSCEQDTGKCQGSCGNRIVEPGEQCDNGDDNGKDELCSEDCINVDPDHYCGNKEVETGSGEVCDLGEDNGKILEGDTNLTKSCTIDCQRFDPNNPTCGNGQYDEGEKCETCAKDFPEKCNKPKCGDGIVTKPFEECDPNAKNGEDIICKECKIVKPECLNGECDTICNTAIDKDCDGCYDDVDPCPDLAGDPNGEYKCCPTLPPGPPETLCPNGDCPLVSPICNQCPCQFADYSNTLQKDDQVRARLRDKGYMVHYNYSNLVNISNFLN